MRLEKAAEQLGLTSITRVIQLIQRGKLRGVKRVKRTRLVRVSEVWDVDPRSVREYAAAPLKRGRPKKQQPEPIAN